MKVAALARISLNSADAEALAAFYVDGLGFTLTDRARNGAALVLTLSLGAQQIELVQFDQPGAPYPQPASSHDPWFQHFAIVVGDVDAAARRLHERARPVAISLAGPVTLPPSSGGVRAVKLRDPELHPFELLQFPPGGAGAIGIDHSAIVVADTARSVAFYEGLGLAVSARSLNQGAEQEALDAAAGVRVAVTGLSPKQATPHVELLCYHAPASPPPRPIAATDIAATRLVLRREDDGEPVMLLDPDGHRLVLIAEGQGSALDPLKAKP